MGFWFVYGLVVSAWFVGLGFVDYLFALDGFLMSVRIVVIVRNYLGLTVLCFLCLEVGFGI